jgi:hypothetical protein
VRETWQPIWADENNPPRSLDCHEGWNIGYPATDGIQEYLDRGEDLTARCKPSIFMPRWASRITLEITDVRVQRVQEISEEDARDEGIQRQLLPDLKGNRFHWGDVTRDRCATAKDAFRALWDSINGKRAGKTDKTSHSPRKRGATVKVEEKLARLAPYCWSANPWVWAITFKRVERRVA